ncbi:hypothetical protein FNV43_RR07129 [Rhamnella rubrinervis]|uniref:Uncharacterized protein n=1 Tax=Rhamnella rubrinervis TaxID=2594499 RepID=A0A8K0MMN3_9ROSA|nr:hypothetical protein FNV43_RR07129 [Rhamnella rubrinervis]
MMANIHTVRYDTLLSPKMMILGLHTMLCVTTLILATSSAVLAGDDQVEWSAGCVRRCGDVEIPYPFGLTHNCSLHANFLLRCDNSSGQPIPLTSNNLTVTHISTEQSEISILFDVARDCYNEPVGEAGTLVKSKKSATLTLPNIMFTMSPKNMFTVIGCESYSYFTSFVNNQNESIFLTTMCRSLYDVRSGVCNGLGCAQTPIVETRFQNMTVEAHNSYINNSTRDFNNCTYAFVVQQDQFNLSSDYITNFPHQKVPLTLDWALTHDTCLQAQQHHQPLCPCGGNAIRQDLADGSGYYCLCKPGFQGNPYLPHGCQDINECDNPSLNNCSETRYCVNKQGNYTCSCPTWFKGDGRKGGSGCKDQSPVIKAVIGLAVGFITLLISGTWMYLAFKKRKLIKLKEKFFQQNGGLILQQQLSQQKDSNKMAQIFTEQELRKATHNYDESTIIGKGGFGVVYKGILGDNGIVAIKKSKIVDQKQIEEFINEVVILSQINHRNVVKLLGCCLETEVPLLVYEYVPNGNLFEHIHDEDKAYNLVWETRLGIAAETAGALSYLHSAASTPIIHRDVKSSNILVNNSMTAKVSDFGASRLIPLGQTRLATTVQGTLGYLDPEYLVTNKLTEKSDVYSFGVVLVELLTGQKALSRKMVEENINLAMHFLSSLTEGRLYEILYTHIMKEENGEQIKQVAELAKRCVSVKGEDRPTMKEVAMELEGIRKTQKHPWVNNTGLNSEETESLLRETSQTNKDYYSTSISNTSISNDAITLDFSGR